MEKGRIEFDDPMFRKCPARKGDLVHLSDKSRWSADTTAASEPHSPQPQETEVERVVRSRDLFRHDSEFMDREAAQLRAKVADLEAKLSLAVEFEVVPYRPWIEGTSDNRPTSIKRREQLDGSHKWSVSMQEWVLAKDGQFMWEPRPSERTDEFLSLTRFDTYDEALAAFKATADHAQQTLRDLDGA